MKKEDRAIAFERIKAAGQRSRAYREYVITYDIRSQGIHVQASSKLSNGQWAKHHTRIVSWEELAESRLDPLTLAEDMVCKHSMRSVSCR